MAKHILTMFLSLLLASISPATSLPSSQMWTLLMLKRLLHNPQALRQWNNHTDLCSLDPSPSSTIVCFGETVTQLHINGEPNSRPLSHRFNISSFFTTLSRLPDLKVLSLTSLGLWGALPPKISRLSKLEILDLSNNYLVGPIPRELSAMGTLQSLILDHNSISGSIPDWLGELPRLGVLSLSNNTLNGTLPGSILALGSLRIIRLSANNLSGEVPDFRELVNLQVIELEDNAFSSRFPALHKKVVTVRLARNRFTGSLPPEIASWYVLQELDIAHNRFVGPFPATEVLALPLLQRLDISGNMFTGMLFQNMSCGDGLSFIDLSNNLLVGNLPECLVGRNVSYKMNCLSNTDEAQLQLSSCQNEALAVGSSLLNRGKPRKSKAAFVAMILGSVVFGIMFVGVLFVVSVRRAGKRNARPETTKKPVEHTSKGRPLMPDARYTLQTLKLGPLGIAPYREYSLDELEAATNNFDSSSFIGEGSYGQMYRGKFQDGSVGAIRCVKLKSRYTSQSLARHIELISKLRHHHLVSSLGHCVEYYLDDSTVSRLFLIFEYIPSGTLRSHTCEGSVDRRLTWTQRISAAIGVAKGIQFLHIGLVPGLFPNNIRTTNILIDQNLVAKIGSYNLPVLVDDITSKFGIGSSSNGANEGHRSRVRPDEKMDVYDFGIILLEIITGKPVSSEGINLAIDQLHAILAADGALKKRAVDPAIIRTCSEESLRTVTEICVRCLSSDPSSRPSIDDVLWNLQFAIQVQDGSSRGDSLTSDGSLSPYFHRPQIINVK